MIKNSDTSYFINNAICGLLGAHILEQRPFHLLISTENWEPALPIDLQLRKYILFSFIGDTLRECSFDTETNETTLFVSILDDENNETQHRINVNYGNVDILSINPDVDGKMFEPIFLRPDYFSTTEQVYNTMEYFDDIIQHSSNLQLIDKDILEDLSEIEEIISKEHSMNMWKNNPDNLKFFKEDEDEVRTK